LLIKLLGILKTHVYFVPGLAANKDIFKNIQLPPDVYQLHVLEWLLPKKRECIECYAKRMAARVLHENAVLVGVSFGGVMVQEMNSYLKLKHLIIISSIKTKFELSDKLRWARRTNVYKIIPIGMIFSVSNLIAFSLGPRSKKKLAAYNRYLSMRDKRYLKWAIKQMICWNREKPISKIHHIHGDADIVFPFKNIKNAILIKGGTHVMILNKGRIISKLLLKIIAP